MRHMRVLLVLLFSLSLVFQCFAQSDSLWPSDYRRSSIGQKAMPFIEYTNFLSVESRSFSTALLYRLRTETTYDQALKNEILSSADQGFSLGSIQSNEVRFAYQSHRNRYLIPFPKKSIALFHRGATTLSGSDDLLRLVLEGNKATAGQVLDLSNFKYEDWLYSGIQFQFAFLLDTLPISVGTSLIFGHTYQNYASNEAELFTASNGSEILFNGAIEYQSSTQESYLGLNGMGLALDFSTEEQWGKHQLKFKLQDLGFIYMASAASLSTDTTISFSGIEINNIFSINSEVFQSSVDSSTNFFGEVSTQALWRFMPFMAQLDYNYHIKKGALEAIYLRSRYRKLQAYRPRLELGMNWKLAKRHFLSSGLNVGGFNNWGISSEYHWQISRYWQLNLGLSHLNNLAISSLAGGSSGYFSLRYYL